MRVCESREEFEHILSKLKLTACPHCKSVGNLIRNGYLQDYDEKHQRPKTVRAQRIFCSNRNRANGCGRTFSVWWADKMRRLFLTAASLWAFLKQAATTGNKFQAFRELNCGLSDSAPYRIWKRFVEAQSAIRTALRSLCQPPSNAAESPAELTLAHLETVRLCVLLIGQHLRHAAPLLRRHHPEETFMPCQMTSLYEVAQVCEASQATYHSRNSKKLCQRGKSLPSHNSVL